MSRLSDSFTQATPCEEEMAEFLDDSIDFGAYMRETDARAKVKPAGTWIDELKTRLRNRKSERRTFLPWEKTHAAFAFRDGEVSLWSGQNGHGKSLMTSQIALSLVGQGERVCVASFEMKPSTTLQRMARMFSQTNPFLPDYQGDGIEVIESLYDQFNDFTMKHLWLYDQMGTADLDKVVGMARYCAKELGIKHVFIDNLAKCVRGEDDFNGQKSFVDEMTAIARDYQCHVHIVHHLRKPANENAVPDKHDNKGSGAITDQVDNVLMVWRNKAKEDDLKAKGEMSTKKTEPDHYLLCRKQRNYDGSGEGEPSIKLWFHRDAQQYLADPADAPMFFPNWPHVETRA
jgi:twinkle protein